MLKQRLFQYVLSTRSECARANTIIRYQGGIGAALVLGGVDATGAHLFTIHPHGSTDKLPYVTMGSGSLAAMAVFESGWKPNLEVRGFLESPTLQVPTLFLARRSPATSRSGHLRWYL